MTTKQAALKKQCHHQTIRDAIRRGVLNAFRHGRDWFIMDDEAFHAYLPTYDHRERVARRWRKQSKEAHQ